MKKSYSYWAFIAAGICFIAGILGGIAYMGFGVRSFEMVTPIGGILGAWFYLIAKRIDANTSTHSH